MTSKTRVFSDVATVGRGARIKLKNAGLLNADDTVVGWARVNPVIRDRMMTETETKQLIVLELTRDDGNPPREDLLARLINYLTSIDREEIRSRVNKVLASYKKPQRKAK